MSITITDYDNNVYTDVTGDVWVQCGGEFCCLRKDDHFNGFRIGVPPQEQYAGINFTTIPKSAFFAAIEYLEEAYKDE